jgi:hypothetical protein
MTGKASYEGRYQYRFMTPEERFWDQVRFIGAGPDDCKMWGGPKMNLGYGHFQVGKKTWKAHRYSFWLANGWLPDGPLDHTCHGADKSCVGGDTCPHRACVEASHLQPATPQENTLAGRGPAAENARKTHCSQGHPFNEENTYVYKGGSRRCRTCDNARQREYKARRRAHDAT